MSDEPNAVHLPGDIYSVKMGLDGSPEDGSIPMAPGVESDETRALFPGLDPSAPAALASEIEAASRDDAFAEAPKPRVIADGHQGAPGHPRGNSPSGGSSGIPPVSGMVSGGVGERSGSYRPVVEYLHPAKAGVKHVLSDPLRVDGVEYREVSVRSPTGNRYGVFQQYATEADTDMEKSQTALVWLVTDLPYEVVENLSIDDREDLLRVGHPFLPRRLRRLTMPMIESMNAADETVKSSTTGTNAE